MSNPLRTIGWPPPPDPAVPDPIVSREWLVANGLGGYASGTVSGVITRRYHGLLIAALPAPLGRVVMLSHVAEQIRWPDGRRTDFGGRERSGERYEPGGPDWGHLVQFRLEAGLPVWRYEVHGALLEKRLFLTHMQNTVRVCYELLDGADQVELALRPTVNFRVQEAPVSEELAWPYEFRSVGDLHEIALKGSPLPPLRLMVGGERATVVLRSKRISNVLYPIEGRSLEPGLLPHHAEQGRARHAHRIDRNLRHDRRARRRRRARSGEEPEAPADRAGRTRSAGGTRRRTGAGCR
jgi:glycogen debranching enzyme